MINDETNSDGIDTLTKSELLARLTELQSQLSAEDVEMAVNCILSRMFNALVQGERIEVRGFGSMSLHYRTPRIGRNPKTGDVVSVPEKYVPHFKPGTDLRKRVDASIKPSSGKK